MRPLDRVRSIKAKLGAVIVASVAATVTVVAVGHSYRVPMPLLAIGAAALSLGMIQLLARGMTSPLREMAAAARAMARGEYGRQVRATSRDEVGELARSFNRMAAELAELDRLRRDLVANASHELRTPIGALQATLENLVDGVEPADRRTLEAMLRQTQRLSRLVAQLLDLSRLESGAMPLERRPFAVLPVIQEASQALGQQDRAVTVTVEAAPAALRAYGDPDRIHQVVANLLENAVRHSPEGGAVTVRAAADGGSVTIAVRDQGPGIPEEERSRVFERFYRSDAARAEGHGGAGLGLAIAQWIVDLHGGSIRIEDAEPGCRMLVELPRPRGWSPPAGPRTPGQALGQPREPVDLRPTQP